MGLRFKFNLVLSLVTLLGLAGSGIVSYQILQKNAQEEVLEMARISSHLVWLATHALDLAAMSVFLYCFREREMILRLLEDMCGQRLNYHYISIGGVKRDFPPYLIPKILNRDVRSATHH